MVQLSAVPNDDVDAATPTGIRERNRLARHRSYLQAALHIVFAEGLDALTMARLATAVDASVGSVYTYFPSKGALLAEVQREAIERLATSATLLGNDLDRIVARPVDPAPNDPPGVPDAVARLAPIVAFGRFWLTASSTYPEEMQLLLLLLSDATETIPVEEAGRVVPAALRLLSLADARIEAASESGALDAREPAATRTVALAAALTGCVQLAVVTRWDPDLLDPIHTGRSVLDALLAGWGADRDAIAASHLVIDRLEAVAPLARPVPGGTP